MRVDVVGFDRWLEVDQKNECNDESSSDRGRSCNDRLAALIMSVEGMAECNVPLPDGGPVAAPEENRSSGRQPGIAARWRG